MSGDYKELLATKDFLYLWTSQILSQLTIQIMNFLLMLVIFRGTGSTIAISFLWVVIAIPAILVGPIASASVDMIDRKKILIITNLLQSAVILIYALSPRTSLFILYAVVLAYSFLNQFYVPAEISSLPSVVKKELYSHANSLFFMTQQAALVIGFGLAGPLSRFIGLQETILLCSLFLFIAFISVTKIRTIDVPEAMPESFEKAFFGFFERIISGYNFIKDHRYVLYPFSIMVVLQIALTIMMVTAPAIAKHIFNIPLELFGGLFVIPAGIGAGLAGLYIPRMLKKGVRKIKIIRASFISITMILFFMIFLIPMLTILYREILGFGLLFVLGYSFVGVLIPSQTFLQEQTPGGYRGRVFGNYWFIVTILTVFPVLISGTLTEIFGIKTLLFFLDITFFAILLYLDKKKALSPVNGNA